MALPEHFRSKGYFSEGRTISIIPGSGMMYGELVLTDEKLLFKAKFSDHIFSILLSDIQSIDKVKKVTAIYLQLNTKSNEAYTLSTTTARIINKSKLYALIEKLKELKIQEKEKISRKQETLKEEIRLGKRKCANCGEWVDVKADICPYCGREFNH